jgi:periplasmic protein TonB
VRAALARARHYPAAARARGQTGTAVLRVTIARDGALAAAALVASSGIPALDAAALEAARRVGRYPAAPADLAGARFTYEVGLAFTLD